MTNHTLSRTVLLAVMIAFVIVVTTSTASAQLTKGNRILGVDLTGHADPLPGDPTHEQDFDAFAGDAKMQHVEAGTVHLFWNQIESAPGVFMGPRAADWDADLKAFAKNNMKIMLVIGTLDTCQRDVPSDLANTRWNDPVMELRFQYFLTWLYYTAVNSTVNPNIVISISIGSEVDTRLQAGTTTPIDNYTEYTAFFNAARTYLKTSTPWNTIPIGVSTAFANLTSTNPTLKSAIATLNTNADEVFYTYYPIHTDLSVEDPYADPVADTYQAILAYPGRTLDIVEAGYPTGSVLNSNDAKQQVFVTTMFNLWDFYYPAIHIVSFLRQTDSSQAGVLNILSAGACGNVPFPAAPAAPTVTATGGTGSTTWKYYVIATNASGPSLDGAQTQITNGVATLNATHYNHITWAAASGATDYLVLRSVAGGTPNTTGEIVGSTSGATSFNDTGLTATAYTNTTFVFAEFLRTLGLRYYDLTGGTYDKVAWNQLGTEAYMRGW
jgi:hypothetical protein